MVRSLANVILKKVGAKLLLLRQRSFGFNLALSAAEQIQNQVDMNLEPKRDKLLAQKVKPHRCEKNMLQKRREM